MLISLNKESVESEHKDFDADYNNLSKIFMLESGKFYEFIKPFCIFYWILFGIFSYKIDFIYSVIRLLIKFTQS